LSRMKSETLDQALSGRVRTSFRCAHASTLSWLGTCTHKVHLEHLCAQFTTACQSL
jgi:hypothetical protein